VANTKYSDLLSDVLPLLTADPSDPVTERAIQRAVIEFCTATWTWKQVSDLADIDAGESTYDIDIPSSADVVTVISLAIGGFPIQPKSIDELNATLPGWMTERGIPRYYTQVDLEQIILAPVPAGNAKNALAMIVALTPSRSSTSFPGWIDSKYHDALVNGAAAYLMLMPDRPWTSLAVGASLRARFEADMGNARASAAGSLGRAPIRSASHH